MCQSRGRWPLVGSRGINPPGRCAAAPRIVSETEPPLECTWQQPGFLSAWIRTSDERHAERLSISGLRGLGLFKPGGTVKAGTRRG